MLAALGDYTLSKILPIIGIAFIIVIIAYLVIPKAQAAKNGFISDIPKSIEGLVSSTHDQVFLIITVTETNEFAQLSASEGKTQLDFPLITTEQKQRKSDIINICKELGLELTINTGTNGAEFLDYELQGTPEEISNIVVKVITKLFNVTPTTPLGFQTNGF